MAFEFPFTDLMLSSAFLTPNVLQPMFSPRQRKKPGRRRKYEECESFPDVKTRVLPSGRFPILVLLCLLILRQRGALLLCVLIDLFLITVHSRMLSFYCKSSSRIISDLDVEVVPELVKDFFLSWLSFPLWFLKHALTLA